MHVIGFEHEHQRPDRDQYVTIYNDNVQPGILNINNSRRAVDTNKVHFEIIRLSICLRHYRCQ